MYNSIIFQRSPNYCGAFFYRPAWTWTMCRCAMQPIMQARQININVLGFRFCLWQKPQHYRYTAKWISRAEKDKLRALAIMLAKDYGFEMLYNDYIKRQKVRYYMELTKYGEIILSRELNGLNVYEVSFGRDTAWIEAVYME